MPKEVKIILADRQSIAKIIYEGMMFVFAHKEYDNAANALNLADSVLSTAKTITEEGLKGALLEGYEEFMEQPDDLRDNLTKLQVEKILDYIAGGKE